MADTIKLDAQIRNEFGKGAARRARRAGLIPAVLYGHGTDPVHLNLPGHATMLAVRQANVLLELEVEGEKSRLALPKQVTRDPLGNVIEHIDLILVKRGEKVTVDVPVVTTGEHGADTMMNIEMNSLSVEADATKLPDEIEVDITGIEAPHQILAGDIKLPEGTTLIADPEALAINFTVPMSEAAMEASLEAPEGEGSEAAAEEAPAGEAAADSE